MNREVDLGKEPVKHLLFILAVPAITSQVVNALYNMVDRMYIGHIDEVGAVALTGVGICFPIIMIVSAFAYLVGMGGAPRASIFMGKRDNKTAEKILGNCFSALIIVAVILTAIVLIFRRPLLYLFGASDNTIVYAEKYITIYAIGNHLCSAHLRPEFVYFRPGVFESEYDDGDNRSGSKHSARSDIHLLAGHGREKERLWLRSSRRLLAPSGHLNFYAVIRRP